MQNSPGLRVINSSEIRGLNVRALANPSYTAAATVTLRYGAHYCIRPHPRWVHSDVRVRTTVARLTSCGVNVQLEHVWDDSFRHSVELLGPDRHAILTIADFTRQDGTICKPEAEKDLVSAALAACGIKRVDEPPLAAQLKCNRLFDEPHEATSGLRLLLRRIRAGGAQQIRPLEGL